MSSDLHLTSISSNDARLKYTFYPLPGGPWQPFVDVNTKESNDPGLLYAVDCAVDGNYLHVPAVTNVNSPMSGGILWHTIHFLDDAWQPCFVDVNAQQSINPGIFYRPVSCAAASGLLHVCCLTTEDGDLWHTTRTTVTGEWQDFENVDTKVPSGIIPGAFFGVDCAVINGDLHVVIITSADPGTNQPNLYHIVLPFGGTWQDFTAVQSQQSNVPSPFVSVSCAAAGGDLHFAGVTSDGTLWHSILPAGKSLWQDFENVSAKVPNTPGPFINDQNGVSCAVADNGDLHVVAITSNGELWRTFLPFGTAAWQPFEDVNAQQPNNPGPFLAVGIAS